MSADFVDDLEAAIVTLAATLTRPHATECVLCYMLRMLDEFGCDGTLRWATRWRDLRVPRATALERRFHARGGFCDCQAITSGFSMVVGVDPYDDPFGSFEPVPTFAIPLCAGVSSRSSQPCELWVPKSRFW